MRYGIGVALTAPVMIAVAGLAGARALVSDTPRAASQASGAAAASPVFDPDDLD